jgi:hypothetical protein
MTKTFRFKRGYFAYGLWRHIIMRRLWREMDAADRGLMLSWLKDSPIE